LKMRQQIPGDGPLPLLATKEILDEQLIGRVDPARTTVPSPEECGEHRLVMRRAGLMD
jgi:hypothetical protein